MAKIVELVNVSSENNNKYYKMTQINDGNWKAEWGRVGAEAQEQIYSMSKWRSKYNEKLKKGYKDITSLKIEDDNDSTIYTEDANDRGEQLLRMLQSFASDAIKENYTISSQSVTVAQVNAAQEIIVNLAKTISSGKNIDSINKNLIELYTIIPRKMKNVKNHLVNNIKRASEILSDEQDLLDVMKQQVEIYLASKNTNKERLNLAEKLGITISIIEDSKLIDSVKKMCGNDSKRVENIYSINHEQSRNRFETYRNKTAFDPTQKLLFHGSRNQNWINILKTSLLIRPSGVILTGAMFGNGIHFADKAIKSIGYTSLSGSYWARGNSSKGFIALYDVVTGIEFEHAHHEYWMNSLDRKSLLKRGNYDSLFAKGGYDLRNNEYIVYTPDQCTIKYLIELN